MMIFSSKARPSNAAGTPSDARFLRRTVRRVARLGALLRRQTQRGAVGAGAVALTLLVACGGGTTQYEAFVPGRLLVFGDDDSAIAPDGRKYGVNGLDVNGAFDCNAEANWVQSLAALYGFIFPQCNPGAQNSPKGVMLALPGAKVSDVASQVEAQVAAGGFRTNDLATVLAGTNDIIALYQQFPALSEATLTEEARARGRRLAQVVNRLVGLGVKVIVSDLPDVGLTPYAAQQNAIGSSERSALISRLTAAFNEQLGVNIVLDGRFVGLVQAQLTFQAIARFPAGYGLTNINTGICTVEPPSCTILTLLPNAALSEYLWADNTRLAPAGQNQLATLAIDRARRNPF